MQKADIPSILTLGYKSQRNALKIHYVTFGRIFIAALFVFPGNWRHFKCLQQNATQAHLKLLRYCVLEGYTHIQKVDVQQRRECAWESGERDIQKGGLEKGLDCIRMMGCHSLRSSATLHMRFNRRKWSCFYITKGILIIITKNYTDKRPTKSNVFSIIWVLEQILSKM